MPRLTISLPQAVYNQFSSIAAQSDESMSGAINQLIMLGMHSIEDHHPVKLSQQHQVEQHCHHLIIQMNALIKNLSAEMLNFNQEDFERLWQAASIKYGELLDASVK
jgi:hypothetical protein